MKIRQDPQFRRERAEFGLRFTCEECALYDAARAECAHGFPTEEHRHARYDDPDATIVFCKEFELE